MSLQQFAAVLAYVAFAAPAGVADGFQIELEYNDEIQIFTTRPHYRPGDATSWIDQDGGEAHNFVYEVGGVRTTGETSPRASDSVRCTAEDPRPQVSFLRGDVNADGILSTADMIALQRWSLSGEFPVTCSDAADVDDDGRDTLRDVLAIAYYLFGTGFGFNGEGDG